MTHWLASWATTCIFLIILLTDTDEVTFKDLVHGNGKDKKGYEKIRFCEAQARRDGLRYFWVDTCCIDKSNNNELSTAINSMFRWYQNATRCYVYLSDVEEDGQSGAGLSGEFTRGWTLQELLAPASVAFFTKEGRRLGDKSSLEKQIYEITGIAVAVLRGSALAQLDVEERFRWAETRQTTHEEDWAYCLLGIFGIFMPLIYGEGKAHAVRRLRKEIDDAVSRGDAIAAHTTTLPIRGQHKRSIWKDGFNHGFYLEKVPLVNRFVGRHEYIADMELCLLPNPKQPRRNVFIVCGLGGMGKTQLAVEFARRHQTTFSSIFFVDGSSRDALLQSFIRVFQRVAINDIGGAKWQSKTDNIENSTSDEITAKALEWFSLEGNDRWLLIYDNVD
ncbi:putative vegetative incompatibility protein HET-E-1, partial [Diaporthe sp. PMI_573]